MSSQEFTKTEIVDGSTGADINAGIGELSPNGGVVIVEQGTYVIDEESDTISIPSNVTLIGRGNVVIEVTENVPAFENSGGADGNEAHHDIGFQHRGSMYGQVWIYR